MTPTGTSPVPSSPPPPSAGPEAPRDRSRAALAAAAVLVIVVVALVLVFGVARPPALEALAEAPGPAPSAGVVWVTFGDDGACLELARTDGSHEQLRCAFEGGDVVGWDDDGIHLRAYGPGGESVDVVDPSSGEVLERSVDDPARLPMPPSSRAHARVDDGVLTVTVDDPDAPVWEVEVPEGYRVTDAAVSPDGAWVAMFDTAGRLLVAPSDGSSEPRVWVEDAATWQVPVWQGTEVSDTSR